MLPTQIIRFLCIVSVSYSLSETDYRLPKTVQPKNYDLSFTIDPAQDTFNGSLVMEYNITDKNVTTFEIHASAEFITIQTVSLWEKNVSSSCTAGKPNNKTDIVVITCDKDLSTFTTVKFTYLGKYSTDDMYGIYKSAYVEDDQKILIATQFEPTYARRAFPCFDEPEFKATFDVSIQYPFKYTAISNGKNSKSSQDNDINFKTAEFSKTPVMSTYLLAFVVSEFNQLYFTSSATENYDFSVYARKSATGLTGTAAKYGTVLLDALSNWTNLSYALMGNSKMDLVAIPEFAAGAMENWGLITYRESDLLDEGNETSALVHQNIILTIAHELAHQWFGDFVTTTWWSEIWLNEGFATYFGYLVANEVTNFDLDNQFVTTVLQPAMRSDALPSATPLSSEDSAVYTPAQCQGQFSLDSYNKGASLLRMMRYIFTDDRLKSLIQTYLAKHQFGNTQATDFIKIINDEKIAAIENSTKYFYSWIYEAGFPLISVTLNSDNTVVIRTEKKFGSVNDSSSIEYYVPISYTTLSKNDFEHVSIHWLEPNGNISFRLNKSDSIVLNVLVSGFYRVNYDETLWRRNIKGLKTTTIRESIHVLNRAQFVDDVFSIANVGSIGYDIAFELAEYLKDETDYYPWYSALTVFSDIMDKLDGDTKEDLMKYINNLLSTALEIEFNRKNITLTHIETLKRAMFIEWGCKVDDKNCKKFIQTEFDNYTSISSFKDYNIRDQILCYGLKFSNDSSKDFNLLLHNYIKSTNPNEQKSLLNAMACSSDETVLTTYLNMTINDQSSVRPQDRSVVFKSVYTNTFAGINVALKFLKENVEKIAESYKGYLALPEVFTGISTKLKTKKELTTFEALIDSIDIEEVHLVKQQSLDIIQKNINWRTTYSGEIKKLLSVSTTTSTEHTSTDVNIPTHATDSTKTTKKPPKGGAATHTGGVLCLIFTYVIITVFN